MVMQYFLLQMYIQHKPPQWKNIQMWKLKLNFIGLWELRFMCNLAVRPWFIGIHITDVCTGRNSSVSVKGFSGNTKTRNRLVALTIRISKVCWQMNFQEWVAENLLGSNSGRDIRSIFWWHVVVEKMYKLKVINIQCRIYILYSPKGNKQN